MRDPDRLPGVRLVTDRPAPAEHHSIDVDSVVYLTREELESEITRLRAENIELRTRLISLMDLEEGRL